MERVREHKNKIAGLRESEDSTRERERERAKEGVDQRSSVSV